MTTFDNLTEEDFERLKDGLLPLQELNKFSRSRPEVKITRAEYAHPFLESVFIAKKSGRRVTVSARLVYREGIELEPALFCLPSGILEFQLDCRFEEGIALARKIIGEADFIQAAAAARNDPEPISFRGTSGKAHRTKDGIRLKWDSSEVRFPNVPKGFVSEIGAFIGFDFIQGMNEAMREQPAEISPRFT